MSSLGHSPIHAPSNQILQPIISGGANPPNTHFTNAYGSMVGGITGCGGAGGSAAALAGNPGYNIALKQHGGRTHRHGIVFARLVFRAKPPLPSIREQHTQFTGFFTWGSTVACSKWHGKPTAH